MREAPAFELNCSLHALERAGLSALSGVVALALLAWVGTHIDAAAAGWPWLLALGGAAMAGALAGWRAAAAAAAGALGYRQGLWTWRDATAGATRAAAMQDGSTHEAVTTPRIDLGSWLLLTVQTPDGAVRWVAVGRRRAGCAWHPLRAALFAPRRRSPRSADSEGALR